MIAAIIEPSRAMGGRHPFPGPSKEEDWGEGGGGYLTTSSTVK